MFFVKTKDDCVFCKIIRGEIPSYTIYEDNDFKVILDRFPSSVGHTLILVKEHVENLNELPPETAAKVLPLAAVLAKKLKAALNCDGINVLQNNGEAAGQSVMHFHMHLIPRYKTDTVSIGWKTQDPPEAEFEALVEKLK